MIPYKWPVATEIPRNPAVRREIVKAMQKLVDDGDEQVQQRRAEIASIKQALAELAQDIAAMRSGAPSLIPSALGKYGYNPEEPRVPKYSTGGGAVDRQRHAICCVWRKRCGFNSKTPRRTPLCSESRLQGPAAQT